MSTVAVFLEYLPTLGVVRVFIPSPWVDPASTLSVLWQSVEGSDSLIAVFSLPHHLPTSSSPPLPPTIDTNQARKVTVTLPRGVPLLPAFAGAAPVLPLSTVLPWNQSHAGGIHVRFGWTFAPAQIAGGGVLSASSSISCRECSLTLAIDTFSHVANLPSDAWEELKDLWVCACTSHMLASSATLAAASATGIVRFFGAFSVSLCHF